MSWRRTSRSATTLVKGAVKKRSQLTTKTMGKKTFTNKKNTVGGQFMAQKKTSKFKGVRKER